MEEETKEVEVVDQFAGSLAVFEPLKAEIAKYKEQNAKIVFQYETAKGEADARSWCYKLRRLKGPLAEVHKIAKAKALAHCQAVDGEKNWCLSEVDEMVKVHMDPIDLKTKRIEEAKVAAAEKLQAEKQAEEDARRVELEEREAAVRAERSELYAEKDRMAGIEVANRKIREQQEVKRQNEIRFAEKERNAKIEVEEAERAEKVRAEHAATQQRIKERNDAANATQRAIDAKNAARDAELNAERKTFEAEKRAEADARTREMQAAEKAERIERDKRILDERRKEMAVQEEAKRVADKTHRSNIDAKVESAVRDIIEEECKGCDCNVAQIAALLMHAIVIGEIPHLKIIY